MFGSLIEGGFMFGGLIEGHLAFVNDYQTLKATTISIKLTN